MPEHAFAILKGPTMKHPFFAPVVLVLCGCLFSLSVSAQTVSQVLSWNNLGMHCMDDDFSVFAILPPYNTIQAQVVAGTNGTNHLVPGTGTLRVNYQAVADADGSINTTSVGKNNFWGYVTPMLGAVLAPNAGLPLTGYSPAAVMPGAGNPLKPMPYETASGWFVAWGIPIIPYDDTLRLNPYPMMHVVTSGGGLASASTDIVLPVSTEMNCRLCHSSGSGLAARPTPDWEWNPTPTRDYRLNILRLHDQVRFQTAPAFYSNALSATGYNTQGLYASVVKSGRPVLCALCHLSEAVPGSGQPGIPQLTTSVHGLHATVTDPMNGMTLGASDDRAACYRCHPGGETRCLRGAMGRAVAPDGTLSMQCQDCHGNMAAVGSPARTGWFEEPNCQACHSGDAVSNGGQIRYDNVYVSNSVMRVPVNQRFATNTNTPLPGLSLFRYSKGHGGLYCSACHGSTHAEFPSAFPNDNVASMQHQGHVGQMSECSACHGANPSTTTGGPHGMHPLGWVSGHQSPAGNPANCRACHGTDYHGTVLSRSVKTQTLQSQTFWRGRRISCYECHNGSGGSGTAPTAPTATSRTATTTVNQPVAIPLTASTNVLRIVNQPDLGMVGLSNNIATYHPATGFVGTEIFTFCSDNGTRESNIATGTVTVTEGGPCSYTLSTNAVSFDELGHVGSIHVTAGGACPWPAFSEALWISILSYSGLGSGDVLYTVERNTNTASRVGFIEIAEKYVTVTQSGIVADANHDGLPDAWQALYFGSANSPHAAPSADPDNDGMSNLNEYLSGTIPNNGTSVLKITSFNVASASHAFQLAFPSLLQRYYQLQRTADLKQPDWKGFTNAVFGTGASLQQVGPTSASASNMFYRVLLVN